tara:strand:+ start:4220 stop:4741 length:522 start_codon:yes stop_codon:yes gene_type:complete
MQVTTDREQLMTVFNPSTGKILAELKADSVNSAERKLTRARALFDDRSRHLPLHERIGILEKLAALVQRDREAFAMLIAKEGGKPLRDARVEVTRAIAGIRLTIAAVGEHRGNMIPLGQTQSSAIMVNDHTAFRDDVMPFAGLGTAGLGVGGIPYTVGEIQFEKMLVLNQNGP